MIFRLGLRLAIRGNKEGTIRQIIITLSTAIGVCLLFFTLSGLTVLNAGFSKPCWSCAGKAQPGQSNDGLLWSYNTDTYKGSNITSVHIAALGAKAPGIPGVAQLPRPGSYVASPAMRRLLQTAPQAEFGARYSDFTYAGAVGNAALTSGRELVIITAETPRALVASGK